MGSGGGRGPARYSAGPDAHRRVTRRPGRLARRDDTGRRDLRPDHARGRVVRPDAADDPREALAVLELLIEVGAVGDDRDYRADVALGLGAADDRPELRMPCRRSNNSPG